MANDEVTEVTPVYGDLSAVRAVRDRGGSGEVLQVLVGNVAVWTWAQHLDGPPSADALALFEALESWVKPRHDALLKES